MTSEIKRILPLQAAKVSAVLYFIIGLVFGLPLTLIGMLGAPEGAEGPGPLFFLFLPFLYALMAFIFVPLFCWLYNLIVRWTGGIEVELDEKSQI